MRNPLLLIANYGKSSLVKNSMVYVITDGINNAIPFVLLPFISRYLTPADYGIVSNFNVLIQVLSVFVYLASAGIIPVMFFKTDKEDLKAYVSNMLALNTIVSLICLLIIFLFSKPLNDGLGFSLLYQIFAVICVWFTSIAYLNLVLWRCEESPLKFGLFQISQSTINALTTVLLVIVLLLSWQGRVYSMFLSGVIMGIISLYVLYKRGYLVFHISQKHMMKIIIFGLPLIPHALSFWFKSGANKLLLSNMCGLSDNGLYSVAMTWGAVVSICITAFSNSYSPWLFKRLATFDKDKEGTLFEQIKLVKMIWLSLILIFVLVGIVYLISYYLTYVIYPQSYYGSLEYLPMIMIGQAFSGGYILFVCFCHYTLNTKVLGAITFSISILQVLFSYILIKVSGPVGVAYSSALASALTFFFVSFYSMRVYKLPWLYFKKDFV